MKTIIVRTVTPQINTGIKGQMNLGEHAVRTVGFDKESIQALLDKHPEALAEMLDAQAHIKFCGPTFLNRTLALCPEIKKDAEGGVIEKKEDYLKRVYQTALEKSKEVAKGEFNFPEIVTEWAAKPRTAKDNRTPLQDFDATVAAVETKWEAASDEGKAALVKSLKLDETLAAGTVEEVVAAIRATYKPAVSTNASDILG